MLEIKNISKSFEKNIGVKDVSFTVGNSSIYGLAGYNGAGKTTLIKSIAGIYKPDSGEALIDGISTHDSDEARSRLVWVSDSPYFLPNATLDTMAGFYSGYYPEFSQSTYEKLAECFELSRDKKLSDFSKGMQRQSALLLALSTKPKTLLIDECFDGLDPTKRILAKDLLLKYMADFEASVLVASHDLGALSGLSDHVGFLQNGTLVIDSDCDDLIANYRKMLLSFPGVPDENALSGLHYRGFKPDIGKCIAVAAIYGTQNEIAQKLATFNIKVLQDLPMTLDEIFLFEMQGSHRNVGEIFK